MSTSKEETFTDYDYFKMRKLDRIYVSKTFPCKPILGMTNNVEKRYIKKVIDKSEEFEYVKVNGEIILRSSPSGRDQVSVTLISSDDKKFMNLVLQKFRVNLKSGLTPIENTDFTFRGEEFYVLLKFLSDLKFINFDDKQRFAVDDIDNLNQKISSWIKPTSEGDDLENTFNSNLLKKLSCIKGEERESLLKIIGKNGLSKDDLNVLLRRKEGLEVFKNEIFKVPQDWIEKDWQKFFQNNPWIFGYGLDYRFLNIIQKEASVSNIDLNGSQTVISDFLMSDTRFTVLVELKKPDTPLFESSSNRSRSWKLSKEITNAVSQILTQKAEWELKSQFEQYDNNGRRISEKTVDPKTILIIGNTLQFRGDDEESVIKAKTFELYRRNSRNIEIITYDELYEKACFIVTNSNKIEVEPYSDTDDLF